MDPGAFGSGIKEEAVVEERVWEESAFGALSSQSETDTRGWGGLGFDSENPGP